MKKFIQMHEEKYIRFPDGKSKALTLSYDDGVHADIRLLEIMNKYGLKGTFNLNSGLFEHNGNHNRLDEESAFELYNNCGQEIALHGDRHIFLDKVPLSETMREMLLNRSYLETKYNRTVRGMAYAYGAYNDGIVEMLKALGVVYARTTESSYSFQISNDWLRLKPTCHHRDDRFKELAEKFFEGSPEKELKHREGWLFWLWGHAYEFDDDNNWELIENFAKRASAKDDIWFATNIEVYEYVTAYKNLIFSLDGERVKNPSAIPVWLEIRGKIYRIDSGKEVRFDS